MEDSSTSVKEFYIEAPPRPPLDDIPGLLDCVHAGGLCFGLADPVTNIILNAIGTSPWSPPEISAAVRRRRSSGCCPALSSLFGLRTLTHQRRRRRRRWVDYEASPCEHVGSLKMCLRDAIRSLYISALAALALPPEYLYFYDCDVSGNLERHPEHASFGSFLASLIMSPEKLTRLRTLLPVPTGERISDAQWGRRLGAFLAGDGSPAVRRATTPQEEMFRFRMSSPSSISDSVRTELDCNATQNTATSIHG